MKRLLPPLLLLAGALSAQSLQVVMHLPSGAIVFHQEHEQPINQPLPAGSLLKVFLAYLAQAQGLRPEQTVFCPPSPPSLPARDACWFRAGHRNQGLVQALANSCDRYFMTAAKRVPLAAFTAFLDSLDLAVQISDAELDREYGKPETMVGLNPAWRFPPLKLLAAISRLVAGRPVPDQQNGQSPMPLLEERFCAPIRQGLREAALYGTARGFQDGLECKVSGKTGTFVRVTPKLQRNRLSGIFIGFFPYPEPEYGVLAFQAAGIGRDQAGAAAELVRKLLAAGKIRFRH